MEKKIERLRRAKRARQKIKQLGIHRLTVHRTPRHIYAQVLSIGGDKVIAYASSLDKEAKGDKSSKKESKNKKEKGGNNMAMATLVGELVAKRAITAGVSKIAFDRSGYKYHGRIKALADAARSNGLEF